LTCVNAVDWLRCGFIRLEEGIHARNLDPLSQCDTIRSWTISIHETITSLHEIEINVATGLPVTTQIKQ